MDVISPSSFPPVRPGFQYGFPLPASISATVRARIVDSPALVPLAASHFAGPQPHRISSRTAHCAPLTPLLTVIFDIDETLVDGREGHIYLRPAAPSTLKSLADAGVLVLLWSAGEREHVARCLTLLDPDGVSVTAAICRGEAWMTKAPSPKRIESIPHICPNRTVLIDNNPLCMIGNVRGLSLVVPDFSVRASNAPKDPLLVLLCRILLASIPTLRGETDQKAGEDRCPTRGGSEIDCARVALASFDLDLGPRGGRHRAAPILFKENLLLPGPTVATAESDCHTPPALGVGRSPSQHGNTDLQSEEADEAPSSPTTPVVSRDGTPMDSRDGSYHNASEAEAPKNWRESILADVLQAQGTPEGVLVPMLPSPSTCTCSAVHCMNFGRTLMSHAAVTRAVRSYVLTADHHVLEFCQPRDREDLSVSFPHASSAVGTVDSIAGQFVKLTVTHLAFDVVVAMIDASERRKMRDRDKELSVDSSRQERRTQALGDVGVKRKRLEASVVPPASPPYIC